MKTNQRKSDDSFEIEFYEGVLRRSPDFIEALSALGDLYTRDGRYEDGLKIDKRLARMRPDDPIVLYNLACSYSLLGDVDKSFVSVKRALALGYDDLEYLQQDMDLENLHSDKKFQDYFMPIWQNTLREQARRPVSQKIFKDE